MSKKEGCRGSCLSWPENLSQRFSKTLFPATFPKQGLGVYREREQPPWTPTSHPHILQNTTKDVDCWVKQRPGEAWGHRGKGQQRPLGLGTTMRITRILQKTPLGLVKKRFYEKFPRKKKSRNCIELRKWHDINHPIWGPTSTPPKGQCVVLNFASSKKSLYYVHTDIKIQFNLHFSVQTEKPSLEQE